MLILKEPKLINENVGYKLDNIEFGYGIDTDGLNIKLNKLSFVCRDGDKKGSVSEYTLGFYTTLQHALERVYAEGVHTYLTDDLNAMNERLCALINTCVASLGVLNDRKKLHEVLKGSYK